MVYIERQGEPLLGIMSPNMSLRLPAAVADRVVVTTSPATATAATTTTAATTSPAATAATATAVTAHLVQARVNLLLGLLENLNKITGLL